MPASIQIRESLTSLYCLTFATKPNGEPKRSDELIMLMLVNTKAKATTVVKQTTYVGIYFNLFHRKATIRLCFFLDSLRWPRKIALHFSAFGAVHALKRTYADHRIRILR